MVLLESVRENLVVNFLGTQFQAKKASMNVLRNSGPLGHFWTKTCEKTQCAYQEKLHELGARSEHTPQKSLRRLARGQASQNC
jgi:hypothetical protein